MKLTRERLERVQTGRRLKAPPDPLAPEKGSLTVSASRSFDFVGDFFTQSLRGIFYGDNIAQTHLSVITCSTLSEFRAGFLKT